MKNIILSNLPNLSIKENIKKNSLLGNDYKYNNFSNKENQNLNKLNDINPNVNNINISPNINEKENALIIIKKIITLHQQ